MGRNGKEERGEETSSSDEQAGSSKQAVSSKLRKAREESLGMLRLWRVDVDLSVIFLLCLILVLQGIQKYDVNSIAKCKACALCIILKLDIKHYFRNKILRSKPLVIGDGLGKTACPLRYKMKSMLYFTNLGLCAWYLILLSGDIQVNPGPTGRIKDPCSICLKGCRTKAIMCDCCDSWYHAKCIGMSKVEYAALGKPGDRWDCIRCLFPNLFTDQIIGKPTGRTACGSKRRVFMIPKLKRGLRLYNKLDSVKKFLKLTSLDVLGLTETWLTLSIDDSELEIDGYSVFFVRIEGQG